jgi:hypothetical protein
MLERTGRCRAEVVRLTNKPFGLQPRDERHFGTLPPKLKAAGCQRVFQEKVSGGRPDGPPAAGAAAGRARRRRHGAWADTTTPHGRLILSVLGSLAEFERHLIAARASEGRKRAVCCSGAPAS